MAESRIDKRELVKRILLDLCRDTGYDLTKKLKKELIDKMAANNSYEVLSETLEALRVYQEDVGRIVLYIDTTKGEIADIRRSLEYIKDPTQRIREYPKGPLSSLF